MHDSPHSKAKVDNKLHKPSAWNQEDHQEYVHCLFFSQTLKYTCFLSISRKQGHYSRKQKERPSIWHIHGLQQHITQVEYPPCALVTFSVFINLRESQVTKTIVELTVHHELLTVVIRLVQHFLFKLLIHILLVIVPFEELLLGMCLFVISIGFFVYLPLLGSCFNLFFSGLCIFFFTPVVIYEAIKTFDLVIPFLFLLKA